jgi:polyhydroxyalkanoate synthesis regulator phasin
MGIAKKGGYIEKLLKKADKALQEGVKKADKALQEGVKKADEVLDDAVDLGIMTAKQAGKTSKELRNKAKKERKALQERGIEKINEGISAAKSATSNTQNDLEILKKIGKLRKAEVITEKEFQAKKKKILDRI